MDNVFSSLWAQNLSRKYSLCYRLFTSKCAWFWVLGRSTWPIIYWLVKTFFTLSVSVYKYTIFFMLWVRLLNKLSSTILALNQSLFSIVAVCMIIKVFYILHSPISFVIYYLKLFLWEFRRLFPFSFRLLFFFNNELLQALRIMYF